MICSHALLCPPTPLQEYLTKFVLNVLVPNLHRFVLTVSPWHLARQLMESMELMELMA